MSMADRVIIRDIDEMSDSRELLEAKTHPFTTWFVTGLIVILLAAGIWSYFGKIDIVVKANGMVRPNDRVVKITTRATGKVEGVYFQVGQKVKAGDRLFTIERDSVLMEKDQLVRQLDNEKRDYLSLFQLREELASDSSSFLSDDRRSEWFFLELDSAAEQLRLDIITTYRALHETGERIAGLALLQQSVQEETNLFDISNEYALMYEDFLMKRRQLEIQAEKVMDAFIRQSTDSGITDGLLRQVEEAKLALEHYTNEFQLSVMRELLAAEKQEMELDTRMDGLYVSLNAAIKDKNEAVLRLEEQLLMMDKSLSELQVTAPIDGVVNVLTDIAVGDFMQPGMEILSIVPADNSEYIVQMAVLNQDIADIEHGDAVKFNFLALPAKEYGHLHGEILSISSDASVNPQEGISYYAVEASLENRPLYNNEGEEAWIKTGMQVEAHIITRSERILYILLEKIDLRD